MSFLAPHCLRQCFADVPDPRREHGRLHRLWDIIALAICAVISGADTWVEVERYGVRKRDWLRTWLDLSNGIPTHDTIGRVFALLNPQAFQDGFLALVATLVEATEGRLIAIDGKTLRRSHDHAAGKAALHLVSAWCSANQLVLGQRAVDGKSNEITAIPELLKLLDLQGAIVTIDAMGCQKNIAAAIVEAKGDYVLALKDNQPTLLADVRDLFVEGLETDFADLEHRRWRSAEERKHGRTERRTYHVVELPEEFQDKHAEWPGLRSVGMVFSERQVGTGPVSAECRYYLLSLAPKVKTFARAVRGHWGIENNLHWVLDVSFREDESRLHKDHGPENLALVRRLAAALLQHESSSKVGVACQRKEAGWDNAYLLRVLGEGHQEASSCPE